MNTLIAQFPGQIREAIEIARSTDITHSRNKKFSNIVICGMGGSGIGAKMVVNWFLKEMKVPMILVQNYTLPGFVNKDSLVIGSSYSGTTEETLAAFHEAEKRGATLIGIGSGGALIQFCKDNKFDFFQLPSGFPPRSMLAYSITQMVYILSALQIINGEAVDDIEQSSQFLIDNQEDIKSGATQLAHHFFQKQGVLYTDVDSEGVVIRARQQFNENSKQLVWHHVIPEMNHNELVGWENGDDDFAVIFLVSQFLSDRNQLRTNLSQKIIGKKTKNIVTIKGKGGNAIEEHFYFIHILDWASVYLAELNKEDTIEVKVIDKLKEELNSF